MPLALLRIVVAVLILTLPAVHAAPAMAALPPNQLPFGIAWLAPYVDPTAASVAWWGVVLGALIGGSGLWTRGGFAAVTVCGAYLLAIPELRGGVQHYHHLLWFSALLAASPCGDALTVWRVRPEPGVSVGWGLPVRVAWLVVALIFFFPGVHKLVVQGPAWAGDNLRWLLLWKWAQSWDFVPLFRLDQHPWLLAAGGLCVLAFELLFPVAILAERPRAVFVAFALAFHAATALLFNIDFGVLWLCYVVFLPFAVETPDVVVERPWRPAALVSAVLLAGIVATGAAGITQGWPFACYPAFDQPVGAWMPTLELVVLDADGSERVVPERLLADPSRSQPYYGEIWGLAGHYGVDDPAARRVFWTRARSRPGVTAIVGDAVELRFYRAELSVDPDRPDVRRGVLIDRLDLRTTSTGAL
jgi:hypothetical protein